MYKNYTFDLYGTLVDIHTDEEQMLLWNKLSAFYRFQGANYTAKELKARYASLVKEALQAPSPYLYKDIQIETVFQSLYTEKGIHPDQSLLLHTGQMFRILSTKYVRLYDGAKELLQWLKSQDKNVYLLSNAQRMFTEYELKSLGIYDLFDGIMISSDAYCSKPDPAFFDGLFSAYNLKKEDSLMIGNDGLNDIKGATTYGIDSFYIHSNQSPKINTLPHCKFGLWEMDLFKVKEMLEQELH